MKNQEVYEPDGSFAFYMCDTCGEEGFSVGRTVRRPEEDRRRRRRR